MQIFSSSGFNIDSPFQKILQISFICKDFGFYDTWNRKCCGAVAYSEEVDGTLSMGWELLYKPKTTEIDTGFDSKPKYCFSVLSILCKLFTFASKPGMGTF